MFPCIGFLLWTVGWNLNFPPANKIYQLVYLRKVIFDNGAIK